MHWYGRKTKVSKWLPLPRPAPGVASRGVHSLLPAGKDDAGEETWDVVQVRRFAHDRNLVHATGWFASESCRHPQPIRTGSNDHH